MKNALPLVALLILPVLFVGCSSPESLYEAQIEDLNELSEKMEAGAKESELEAIAERIDKRHKKINDLPADKRKELDEKYADELAAAGLRFLAAMMKYKEGEFGKRF